MEKEEVQFYAVRAYDEKVFKEASNSVKEVGGRGW